MVYVIPNTTTNQINTILTTTAKSSTGQLRKVAGATLLFRATMLTSNTLGTARRDDLTDDAGLSFGGGKQLT